MSLYLFDHINVGYTRNLTAEEFNSFKASFKNESAAPKEFEVVIQHISKWIDSDLVDIEISDNYVIWKSKENDSSFEISLHHYSINHRTKLGRDLLHDYDYTYAISSTLKEKGTLYTANIIVVYKNNKKNSEMVNHESVEEAKQTVVRKIMGTWNYSLFNQYFTNIQAIKDELLNKVAQFNFISNNDDKNFHGSFAVDNKNVEVDYAFPKLKMTIKNAHKYSDTELAYGALYRDPVDSIILKSTSDVKNFDIVKSIETLFKHSDGIFVKSGTLGS